MAQGVKKKNGKPFAPSDFLPFTERARETTGLTHKVKAVMANFGAA